VIATGQTLNLNTSPFLLLLGKVLSAAHYS
jgi:hypothetical protein